MELIGKIKSIANLQKVSEKFSKREFVLTTNEQYPQIIQMQLTNAKTSLLDSFSVGDDVTISINIRGREWTDPKNNQVKVFNTIEAWKIEKLGTATIQTTSTGDFTF